MKIRQLFLHASLLSIYGILSCSAEHDNEYRVVTEEKNVEVNKIPVLKDGSFEDYFPDGKIKIIGEIKNGSRTGIWISYFPNGNKQSESNYQNGILHGKTVTHHSNGQIRYIGYYMSGEYDGQWFFFDEQGGTIKEVIYNKGEEVQINTEF